jgi:Fe-Mn family superoxide dismutase
MDKRTFLKLTGTAAAGAVVVPTLTFCSADSKRSAGQVAESTSVFELKPLPYAYSALEPYIDALTMEIHHGKHHAAYTNNLNTALAGGGRFTGLSIEAILAALTTADEDKAVRNNGGGYYNHNLFWEVMKPGGGGSPSGVVGDAIAAAFGSWDACREALSGAAMKVFGSGWAWLCKDPNGALFVSSTANQDNPLMQGIVQQPGTPILGLDVWEHAYYLKHQNRRADYVGAFFDVVNWDAVASRYAAA